MSFTDVAWFIGRLIEKSFSLLEAGQNNVNWAIIGVGACFFVWWCTKQIKSDKEADMNGTMR